MSANRITYSSVNRRVIILKIILCLIITTNLISLVVTCSRDFIAREVQSGNIDLLDIPMAFSVFAVFVIYSPFIFCTTIIETAFATLGFLIKKKYLTMLISVLLIESVYIIGEVACCLWNMDSSYNLMSPGLILMLGVIPVIPRIVFVLVLNRIRRCLFLSERLHCSINPDYRPDLGGPIT